MKKLILLPVILVACSNPPAVETKESFIDSSSLSDTITVVGKVEAALKKTEGLEDQIKETYKTKETLLQENNSLKLELKVTKDSLSSKEAQLIEVKRKLPKKQNLLQKVFNIAPDSIEITSLDTIQK